MFYKANFNSNVLINSLFHASGGDRDLSDLYLVQASHRR